MNKFCKGLITVALATAVSFSSGVSVLAAEKTTEAEIENTVKSYKHIATLYEPETRETLEYNTWEKFLGNVYNSAMPTVVTAGKTTMMSLTDLKEVVESKSSSNSDNSFLSTLTTTVCGSMYSVFNEKNQTWETPKYITASSADWLVEGMILQSDGKDIYALCMEFKNDDTNSEGLFESVFSGQLPQNQIVIHKYSPETASFSVFKVIEAKEGYTKLNPQLVFENDAIVATWCEMKNKSVFEMMSGTLDFAFGYSRYKDNNWSEAQTLADTQVSAKNVENTLTNCPYAAGTIEGKLAIAYVDKYGEKNLDHILFKNEHGTLLLGKECTPEMVMSAYPSTNDGFYYLDDGKLYFVNREIVDGQKKLVHKELARDLPDAVEIDISENNELYYRVKGDVSSLFVRDFDSEQNKFVSDRVLREKDTEISNISVANFKDKTMIVILTDETKTQALSETDAKYCGYDVSYMLFNKAKAGISSEPSSDNNTSSEPTISNTDKNPSEKPSDIPTTSINHNDADDETESTTKDDSGYKDSNNDTSIDTPDTGVSKVVGVAAAALVVSGLLIVILKKKKD